MTPVIALALRFVGAGTHLLAPLRDIGISVEFAVALIAAGIPLRVVPEFHSGAFVAV